MASMQMQTSSHQLASARRWAFRSAQSVRSPGFRSSSPLLRDARCRASTKIPPAELLEVAIKAAQKGAEVVMDATSKPKNIQRKDGTPDNIVTDTDKAAEVAIVSALQQAFPSHAILGEEGGVLGDVASEYLWCLDPVDGTCNFSTGYQSFCVSVGVLRHALPVAGCVIEFIGGGPGGVGDWRTRQFTASRNGGAFLDGKPLRVSRTKKLGDAVIATEACWDEEKWPMLSRLYADFTRQSRGVRMSGAAAANCCHLAMGVIDAYWQYDLKPWDVAAGALILEEAGGRITTGDGVAWSVFDRSLVASNDAVHEQVTALTEPATLQMLNRLVDLKPWHIPKGYSVRAGAQLA